ncbi:type II toxin-antitoxin system PemK/MazF family toxin [Paenibacillus xerothermodurans]
MTIYTMSSTATYQPGDVWIASVYQTATKQFKVRPIVIVGNDKAIDVDVLTAPITTHAPKVGADIILFHWQVAGLARESVARTSKLFPVSKDKLIKKLGSLHPDDLLNVLNKCRELF